MVTTALRLRRPSTTRLSLRLAGLALPLALLATEANALEAGEHPSELAASSIEATASTSQGPDPRISLETVDPGPIRGAIEAYRRGALAEGDALARGVDNPAAQALLEWAALRAGANPVPFARLNAFLQAHPDYPAIGLFRRRAEEALVAERRGPEVVRAFFADHQPVSPAGRVALALALQAKGETAEALALIRQSWVQDPFGAPLERLVLASFPTGLTREDHKLRAERFIFRGNAAAALRNAALVSPDFVKLAQARIASAKAKRPLAPSQIASLPAAVHQEPGYALLKAQQARREGKPAEAAKALSSVPRDPALLGDGDGWWVERRLIARDLLDEGEIALAYAVAAEHGAEDSASRIDAEWHAGFIALRFHDAPMLALDHFRAAAELARTPISVARIGYWEGRALEALGREDEALAAYRKAGEHPVAYYGQLALARLGERNLQLRGSDVSPLGHLPGHQGVQLLYRIGERQLAAQMLADLAQRLQTTPALESIAQIAQAQGDVRAVLAIGKQALQRGFPLDAAAFPTNGVPDFPVLGDPMERAIVHAIARQESAFDPTATSHAGARGLMQMMPATARETARRASLPFDWPRLGRDPLYSAVMGAAHLIDLLKEWRGSYILTFAAYNAGSGNVRKWIAAYGDPRRPDVDAIDWVERIPFYETRNYVQRVMENVQVYRHRLDQRTAYMIDHDLKRGGRRE
ncbi:lytic transglycosylase domain-containing protein [Bosea sp. Leaf344]|uniref:lytic transglycosylase domain-containing protein n=1 Tax=Bosea sp. Leaf344 TaxID=1736346 RepID=UPI0006FF9E4F|nr:lytic transglycosylase domain-containing protein [Bosea sp. Leaf344]